MNRQDETPEGVAGNRKNGVTKNQTQYKIGVTKSTEKSTFFYQKTLEIFNQKWYNKAWRERGESMKKSNELDIQKLNRIIKSLTNIKNGFEQNEINNANDLKNDEMTQAACTQFITNIQEAKKKLQDETYNKLVELNRVKLAEARNIASHDYDSIDFVIIYRICERLVKPAIFAEVSAVLSETERRADDD